MNKFSFSVLFSFLIGTGIAQNFCHTTEMQKAWFDKNPHLKEAFDKQRAKIAAEEKERPENGTNDAAGRPAVATAIYTIPVVFHILHMGGNENISDAQVIDAVNILTRDFNKLNADTANVVAAFKNNIGNAKIEFQLATKDPN